MASNMLLIWVSREAKNFCNDIWTTQITLIALPNFLFRRMQLKPSA
jgi:hypothetical protein